MRAPTATGQGQTVVIQNIDIDDGQDPARQEKGKPGVTPGATLRHHVDLTTVLFNTQF